MFPILKNSTILKIMEEVKVPLTESELTEPGRCKERVREVFVQLVSFFMELYIFVVCPCAIVGVTGRCVFIGVPLVLAAATYRYVAFLLLYLFQACDQTLTDTTVPNNPEIIYLPMCDSALHLQGRIRDATFHNTQPYQEETSQACSP